MQDLKNKTDAEIVKLSLDNDACFEELVERYEAKLMRYILRIASLGKETAEDLLQEVFVKVYQNLNDFDSQFLFSSWIYKITHNVVISYIRKSYNGPKFISIDDDEFYKNFIDLMPGNSDLPKELDSKNISKKVRAVLLELPEGYREVLVLYYLEEKSYKEISDILERPINSVSVMINRAKKQLKEKLNFLNS
ncbi:sigma-70 family RNA polymerase sigma factor [Candidatus Gracilibacteria bacterium]|nr:sigma-70 family RNA polymerase sigma factor [Candidatus Gracilibacteria bacterium]